MRFSNCYCFLLHGYTGMFDYWFKNGRKEPPREMGSYVSEFRHDLIKNLIKSEIKVIMVQRSKCHCTVLCRAFCVERDGVICYNQRNGTGGAMRTNANFIT